MKFNFKKIASVLATTVMLGSTVAFASAAWPAPFVVNGAADAAVVYGANAPASGGDMASATDLGAALDAKVTVGASSTAPTGGDSVKLAKSTNLFNLGDNMSGFYSTLDKEELRVVLADGIYSNDANNEFDYEQTIKIGNGLTLTHFQDSDFNNDEPIIGFKLNSGQHILNYTLKFTPDKAEGGTNFKDLETTDLTMLGRSYYIVKAEGTSSGVKLTLLDNANSAIVSEGETKTVSVGSAPYNVKIVFIDDDEVILEVNGVKTNKMKEGDVFKVGTNTYVAVKNILYNQKESGISQAEISIGSGKIVLENGKEVKINNEDVSDLTDQVLTAYITNSSTDISQITLEWKLDDEFFIAPGTSLLLPGFETIKLSMTGFNMPKEEKTVLKADSEEKFYIDTTVTDGKVKLYVLYNNDTNILGIGEKETHKLVTNASSSPTLQLNLTEKSYFVATWVSTSGTDYETYVYEISSIDDNNGKNSTKLKNLAGGSEISFSEVGDNKDKGNINFELLAANKNSKTASVKLTPASSGTVKADRIITKEGMQILLPVNVGPAAAGNKNGGLNMSSLPASWTTNITEEDRDGKVAGGKSFTVTMTINADDGLEPSSIDDGAPSTYETSDGSKQYVGYMVSDLATKLLWNKPSSDVKSLEITYAGEESYADVYISEAAVSFTGGVSGAVKVVTDAEVNSVKDKNLLVVGGSCINTVAATLLGSSTPMCGAAFTTATGVDAGKYLIQVVASPYNAQKVAMLIAGYEGPDTAAAVAKVKEGTVDTKVGTKVVGPVLA